MTKQKKSEDGWLAAVCTENGCYYGAGKVIGEFVCDRTERLARVGYSVSRKEPEYFVCDLDMRTKPIDDILSDGYLSREELETYLAGAVGYAWHISDLKIYDKPKKLTDFIRPKNCGYGYDCETCNVHSCATRPPQSWRYVAEA